jgi:hypothetical protein
MEVKAGLRIAYSNQKTGNGKGKTWPLKVL